MDRSWLLDDEQFIRKDSGMGLDHSESSHRPLQFVNTHDHSQWIGIPCSEPVEGFLKVLGHKLYLLLGGRVPQVGFAHFQERSYVFSQMIRDIHLLDSEFAKRYREQSRSGNRAFVIQHEDKPLTLTGLGNMVMVCGFLHDLWIEAQDLSWTLQSDGQGGSFAQLIKTQVHPDAMFSTTTPTANFGFPVNYQHLMASDLEEFVEAAKRILAIPQEHINNLVHTICASNQALIKMLLPSLANRRRSLEILLSEFQSYTPHASILEGQAELKAGPQVLFEPLGDDVFTYQIPEAPPGYVDRPVQQTQLLAVMESSKKCVISQSLLPSWGGVGKTYLALWYLYSQRAKLGYTSVIWIYAALNIEHQIRDLARKLGISSANSIKDTLPALYEHLALKPPVLLVWDGAESMEGLRKFLPKDFGSIHTLITSPNSSLWEDFPSVSLSMYGDPDHTRKFVLGVLPTLTRAEMERFLTALHRHPLAVTIATAFIKEQAMSTELYLGALYFLLLRTRTEPQAPTPYEMVNCSLLLVMLELQTRAPLAWKLLQTCVGLGADMIPRHIIEELSGIRPEPVEEALSLLASLALVYPDSSKQNLGISRMVMSLVDQLWPSNEERANHYCRLIEVLTVHFNLRGNESNQLSLANQLSLHVPVCLHLGATLNLSTLLAQMMIQQSDFYMEHVKDPLLAVLALNFALEVFEKSHGGYNPCIVATLQKLAAAHALLGNATEQQLFTERCQQVEEYLSEEPTVSQASIQGSCALNEGLNSITANRSQVITDSNQFMSALHNKKLQSPFSHDVFLVGVDFSTQSRDFLKEVNLEGVYVMGDLALPQGLSENELISRGAVIIKPMIDLPFNPMRTELYTVEELGQVDAEIFQWVHQRIVTTKQSSLRERVMVDLHDSQILAALRRYVMNHYVVGVMGGHNMLRGDPMYTSIALLCRQLAIRKFLVVTGGGSGAMEAANLGAFFSVYEERDLLEAIAMLRENKHNITPEYKNYHVADLVLDKYYRDDAGEYSLGVPTFFYGDEPYNRFAKRQAKFASNAIREDILVNICNCGIIFTPGQAGTRTEIFQYAVPNAYASEEPNNFSKPMIFYGVYWLENGLFQSLANVAQNEDILANRPLGYSTKLYCVREPDQVLAIIENFKTTYYESPEFPIARPPPSDPDDAVKQMIAQQAVQKLVVRTEMIIGVGSSPIVSYVIDQLSYLAAANNWHLICVPASIATREALKKKSNLAISSLIETSRVDVVFDGTDETDVFLNQIKGGGALLQEKILAASTDNFVVIGQYGQDSKSLGKLQTPVPIEVHTLAYKRVKAVLVQRYGIQVHLRKAGQAHQGPFFTDNSNVILDAWFRAEHLANPASLELYIKKIPGVLEVGLFCGMASRSFFGNRDGARVNERIRVFTMKDVHPPVVPHEHQFRVLQTVLKRVAATKNAVVEMDLDLTSFSPYERTISALQKAGREYCIKEFHDPVRKFRVLPGYTMEAWNAWLMIPEVVHMRKAYHKLPWKAKNPNHGFAMFGTEHSSIWSSFHIHFWQFGEPISRDIPVAGLVQFEHLIREAGGKMVFFSGRCTPEQRKGTEICLKKSGIPEEHIHLLVGDHDKNYNDADYKVQLQKLVVQKYGTPVAFFDDRKKNLDALARAYPKLMPILVMLPGYSYAPFYGDVPEFSVATFEMAHQSPELSTVSKDEPFFDITRVSTTKSAVICKQKQNKLPATISADAQRISAPIPKVSSSISCVRVGSFNVENLYSRFQFAQGANVNISWSTNQMTRQILDDPSKRITAEAIKKLNADILALEEVEDMQTLNLFIKQFLSSQGYDHRYLIEGNDPRGMSVALVSRFPIVHLRSYCNERNAQGEYIFNRDCLEVTVMCPDQNPLRLYINHFKSMTGSRYKTAPRRREQVAKVIEILEANHGADLLTGPPFIVMGDFNDYADDPQNSAIWPLVNHTGLYNAMEFIPDPNDRWTHYWEAHNEYQQLDYLLLSSHLCDNNHPKLPIIIREGQPGRATKFIGPRFPGVGFHRPKASDHCPIGIDIEFPSPP